MLYLTGSFMLHRCGNVAAILELDENLNKQFRVFDAAPQVGTNLQLIPKKEKKKERAWNYSKFFSFVMKDVTICAILLTAVISGVYSKFFLSLCLHCQISRLVVWLTEVHYQCRNQEVLPPKSLYPITFYETDLKLYLF